jgi:hypothetical protein
MVINKQPELEGVPPPTDVTAATSPVDVPQVLEGAHLVARRRLSTADDQTLADVGETCERVPAASLRALFEAGHIAMKESV